MENTTTLKAFQNWIEEKCKLPQTKLHFTFNHLQILQNQIQINQKHETALSH